MNTATNATKPLDKDQAFFFVNAGFSVKPDETTDEGRTRGAIELAADEVLLMHAMRVAPVHVVWGADDDAEWEDASGGCERIEQCQIIYSPDGAPPVILAGLYSIEDPNTEYRRVIRAELVAECRAQLLDIIAGA